MPTSASLASPGPLTSQPITATLIGLFICLNILSTSLASFLISTSALPQLGQAAKTAPSLRRSNDFSISIPDIISSTGESLKETLIVSPIPSYNKTPNPTALLILPDFAVPASVMPKCKG